jgi:hypothetical protein
MNHSWTLLGPDGKPYASHRPRRAAAMSRTASASSMKTMRTSRAIDLAAPAFVFQRKQA